MNTLPAIIQAHKSGQAVGIYSICSANPYVIRAGLAYAQQIGAPALIESTSNQVNQYGGYTHMTPADFVAYLHQMVQDCRFPSERIILGGDHLGPGVWQGGPAAQAMDEAHVLVHACIQAGYTKIHLDASMACADDPAGPLDVVVSANRTAELVATAEAACHESGGSLQEPYYVIGTEVPPPGGIQGEAEEMRVTPVEEVRTTIEVTRQAFIGRGLHAAWDRVIAVVVQPGVEYGDDIIHDYRREAAAGLSRFIEQCSGLVYEAHSTDYQTPRALRYLVEDHFAVLKVGPALTFAFREAAFALAMIEEELQAVTGAQSSQIRAVLDAAMMDNPTHWKTYYHGSQAAKKLSRQYSLSDRLRYYWPVKSVQDALVKLFANLGAAPIPLPLLSQYLPLQYRRIRSGDLGNRPEAIVLDRIRDELIPYGEACGYQTPS